MGELCKADTPQKIVFERRVKVIAKSDGKVKEFSIRVFRIPNSPLDPEWMVAYAIDDGHTGRRTTLSGMDDMQAICVCVRHIDSMLFLMKIQFDISIAGFPFDEPVGSIFLGDEVSTYKTQFTSDLTTTSNNN